MYLYVPKHKNAQIHLCVGYYNNTVATFEWIHDKSNEVLRIENV